MPEKSVSSEPVNDFVDGYSITADPCGYEITDPEGTVIAQRKQYAASCSTTWAQAAKLRLAEIRHGQV